MEKLSDLFKEFPTHSKEEWLDKVIRDIKGRPVEELNLSLSDDLTFPPFYHPDDKIGETGLAGNKQGNSWTIGEEVRVLDFQEANTSALQALEGGAEALHFAYKNIPLKEEHLVVLLKDIEMDYISSHFSGAFSEQNIYPFLQAFDKAVERKNNKKELLQGSFFLNREILKNAQLFKKLVDFNKTYPGFKLISIDSREDFLADEFSTIRELTTGLVGARQAFRSFSGQDIPAEQACKMIHFSFAIGNNHLVEIAKFRAFRLLWANFLKAFDIDVALPAHVFAFQVPSTFYTDTYRNMIQATTQAMSAVIGGVDQLYLLPANSKTEEPTPLTRRIARNVQHILKMESFLDKVSDPAGGSYYLEKLTVELAEKAWEEFQKIK